MLSGLREDREDDDVSAPTKKGHVDTEDKLGWIKIVTGKRKAT